MTDKLRICWLSQQNKHNWDSRPLVNVLLAITLFAAVAAVGTAASADAQTESNSIVAQIGDEARAALLTTTGTLQTTQLERLTDSQLKLRDTAGAKKSIAALKAILTQQSQINSFQFDKAVILSVRLKDDNSILASIDGLPTDAKIHALGTYGATKAKASDAAAVNDTVAQLETILPMLPPDPPVVQPAPPPLYPQPHVYTRHGIDLAYWQIGVAAAENGEVPLSLKIAASMTNDLLRIRVLAAIARRQHQDDEVDQSFTTLADLQKLAEATTVDHDQAIATALAAYAGCGDLKAVLGLAPALTPNDQLSTMTAAARRFFTDGDPSAVIEIATRYKIDPTLIPSAIDQIYRQGRIDEAKKAYALAFDATRQRANQPASTVGQQIDGMSSVTTLIDGEIAIHNFTSATNHLRTLSPNATISLAYGAKIIAAEIEAKDKSGVDETVPAIAFFVKNFPQPLSAAHLEPARALAKAGYAEAAKTVLEAVNDRAEGWQGPLRLATLKLLLQAYDDIGDAQAAAAVMAKIAAIDAAPAPAPAPPGQMSEADLEKGKRIKAAADVLNEPNNGSREAQQALIDRALKAVSNDGQAVEVAIFAGALLNPNARAAQMNQKRVVDLLDKGQFNDAIGVAQTLPDLNRNGTLQQIATAQAKSGDLNAAYATIHYINDPETRAFALVALLEATAQRVETMSKNQSK